MTLKCPKRNASAFRVSRECSPTAGCRPKSHFYHKTLSDEELEFGTVLGLNRNFGFESSTGLIFGVLMATNRRRTLFRYDDSGMKPMSQVPNKGYCKDNLDVRVSTDRKLSKCTNNNNTILTVI